MQGDTGHAEAEMVTDVYSEIVDEDRRLNAERMDQAFYAVKDKKNSQKDSPEEVTKTDEKILLELLKNLPDKTRKRLLKMSETAC